MNEPTTQPETLSQRLAHRLVGSPAAVRNIAVMLLLGVALAGVLGWSRGQPKVAVDQVMHQARVVRAGFAITDKAGTESERELKRANAPRVYVAEAAVLEEVLSAIANLPRALAKVESPDQVASDIREQFAITPAGLAAVRGHVQAEGPDGWWLERVKRLDQLLRRTPLVDDKTFQQEVVAVNDEVELRPAPEAGGGVKVRSSEVLSTDGQKSGERLRAVAALAGFSGDLLDVVAARLTWQVKPTYKFDKALTDAVKAAAADGVEERTVRYGVGQLIYAPGDVLTREKLDLVEAEARAFGRQADARASLTGALGVLACGVLAAVGLGAYIATYSPGIWGRSRRVGAVAAMTLFAVLLSGSLSTIEPRMMGAALVGPAVLVTFILAVAFERRTALAVGSLTGILACVAAEQPPAAIGLSLSGVWCAVWQLRESRSRNTLIRSGLVSGAVVTVSALAIFCMYRPIVGDGFRQLAWDALGAGGACLMVGFIVLGTLPSIEKAFGVTTGMTLIELRDPKQPLLRALQQRAPGTYNHALNVAALAEAAAEAIGADGLLTYVGALYHDIGKMNKPEYFVENQAGGLNRHDKLPPAMSLLLIVGHVKEGIELAREHGLPRPLWHFIESHHGTTLVEYFFHRARKAAEARRTAAATGGLCPEAVDMPEEIEFRYPGPKPATREAALVMLCDASESATRSLPEPSPARIDSLVRGIAHKRLLDGQFDACDLTLRELNTAVEAVSRTLAAIYHQRIAYPEAPTAGARGGAVLGSAQGTNGAGARAAASVPVAASATVGVTDPPSGSFPMTGDLGAPVRAGR
jgi:putative nucleotidyltransferase with HDIG domain